MTLSELQLRAFEIAVEKGFETPGALDTRRDRHEMLAKLMLLATEVSEAAEAVRSVKGVPEVLDALGYELADVVIRVAHIMEGLELDLELYVRAKMEKNAGRPRLHGKETTL